LITPSAAFTVEFSSNIFTVIAVAVVAAIVNCTAQTPDLIGLAVYTEHPVDVVMLDAT
jgi:hypothetical protein